METLKADNRSRVKLPQVKPGQVFCLECPRDGQFVLTRVRKEDAAPNKVRFEKRGGFTVGVPERPVDPELLKQELAEFP
jgi:hypothetical protein